MKKIILFCVAVSMYSCGQKSTIDKNIEAWIKANAHNPETYEPVETKLISSDKLGDKLQREIKQLEENKASNAEKIKEYKQRGWSDLLKDKITESDKEASGLEEKRARLDSLNASANTNPISSYSYIHKLRVNVPLGGKMLKSLLVTTDANYNIIYAIEE